MTKVVHVKRSKYDIYIGRPSIWGNPYVVGYDFNRTEVVRLYEQYIRDNRELMMQVPNLRGKILGCWCKPLLCHGDVLASLADNDLYLEVFDIDNGIEKVVHSEIYPSILSNKLISKLRDIHYDCWRIVSSGMRTT